MIIAKHPGLRAVLSKMASEAGFPHTRKVSRAALIVDQDDIFLIGALNGRVICAQGNFYQVGIHNVPHEGEFIACRLLGSGQVEKFHFGEVLEQADGLRGKDIVAWGDDTAGRRFRLPP